MYVYIYELYEDIQYFSELFDIQIKITKILIIFLKYN